MGLFCAKSRTGLGKLGLSVTPLGSSQRPSPCIPSAFPGGRPLKQALSPEKVDVGQKVAEEQETEGSEGHAVLLLHLCPAAHSASRPRVSPSLIHISTRVCDASSFRSATCHPETVRCSVCSQSPQNFLVNLLAYLPTSSLESTSVEPGAVS